MKKMSSENAFLIMNSQVIPLTTEISTVGRKLSNTIVIQNELVSRKHAVIRYEYDQFVIYDQQSTGGSFVNNKRVDRCILHSGDIISLSGCQIMFVNNSFHLRENENAVTKGLL